MLMITKAKIKCAVKIDGNKFTGLVKIKNSPGPTTMLFQGSAISPGYVPVAGDEVIVEVERDFFGKWEPIKIEKIPCKKPVRQLPFFYRLFMGLEESLK